MTEGEQQLFYLGDRVDLSDCYQCQVLAETLRYCEACNDRLYDAKELSRSALDRTTDFWIQLTVDRPHATSSIPSEEERARRFCTRIARHSMLHVIKSVVMTTTVPA